MNARDALRETFLTHCRYCREPGNYLTLSLRYFWVVQCTHASANDLMN
jgi:hypothetical protein